MASFILFSAALYQILADVVYRKNYTGALCPVLGWIDQAYLNFRLLFI